MPPLPCAAPCASGTSPSPPCCCCCRPHSWGPWNCARTSSTTSAPPPATLASWKRASRTFFGAPVGAWPELVEYGPLVLNLETSPGVSWPAVPCRYLHGVRAAQVPRHSSGQGFHRETLLSWVWGYEYYGGARTVDVHIRRLRAKLGEEHANLISTVRSVGYRFGQSRWTL